jgi:chromosomal replication initiation ATPase DnaA
LCSAKRTRDFAYARFAVMRALYQRIGHSLPRIGRLCGGRDHTSVLNGIRKSDKLLESRHPLYMPAHLAVEAEVDRIEAELRG